MDGSDTRTGQHRHSRFSDHGHVDQDAIAFFNALFLENAGKLGDFIPEFIVGVFCNGVSNRTVVDQGKLLSPPLINVIIQCVVACIDLASREPPVKWFVAVV
jgi:hypothetical protein